MLGVQAAEGGLSVLGHSRSPRLDIVDFDHGDDAILPSPGSHPHLLTATAWDLIAILVAGFPWKGHPGRYRGGREAR